MKTKTRTRLRWAGALLIITALAIFASSLPSRLPPEEVTAREQALASWKARHLDDITHGRSSSAGPEPSSSKYTEMSSTLAISGLLICLIGVIVILQTLM